MSSSGQQRRPENSVCEIPQELGEHLQPFRSLQSLGSRQSFYQELFSSRVYLRNTQLSIWRMNGGCSNSTRYIGLTS